MFRSSWLVVRLVFAASLLLAPRAGAIDLLDGRVEIHGSIEEVVRGINQDWHRELDLTQMRTVLGLEAEIRLLDSSIGPLDELSTFVRFEVSYDCVWTRACGFARSADAYGDRTVKVPSKYTNGSIGPLIGDVPTNPSQPFAPNQENNRLIPLKYTPPFWTLGPNVSFEQAFRPLLGYKFAVSQLHVTTADGNQSGSDALVLPWRPKDHIDAIASLASVANQTAPPAGLPMRPSLFGTVNGSGTQAGGLYAPSPGLREILASGRDISRFDQNFSQKELAWNRGASQQDEGAEGGLSRHRDARRAGSSCASASRPSSGARRSSSATPTSSTPRISRSRPCRASRSRASRSGPRARSTRSTRWARSRTCASSWPRTSTTSSPTTSAAAVSPTRRCRSAARPSALLAHGMLGARPRRREAAAGLRGRAAGLEIGARLEFRWDRFSFALTDFYGYQRLPVPG